MAPEPRQSQRHCTALETAPAIPCSGNICEYWLPLFPRFWNKAIVAFYAVWDLIGQLMLSYWAELVLNRNPWE